MSLRRILASVIGAAVIAAVSMQANAQNPRQRGDATRLAMEGLKLDDGQARALEDTVNAKPDDLDARSKLLGYYSMKRFGSEVAKVARQGHVLWIVEHRPGAEIAGTPFAQLDPVIDGDAYETAKALWSKEVEAHPKDASVLRNAAAQALLQDGAESERLLRRGRDLEPRVASWSQQLGHLKELQMSSKAGDERKQLAAEAFAEYERAYTLAADDDEKSYLLAHLAKTAFEAGKTDKANDYATRMVVSAAKRKKDWNTGNAIHQGNLILGRLAFQRGDFTGAKVFLHEAGKTPGSPQLNSFGPNMALAKDLLERGETKAVLDYFELCGKFWKLGQDRLDAWTTAVKAGEVPDFGANLNY